MTLAVRLSIGFAIACALAYALTPFAIALADRLQFYDKPIGYKGHLHPDPVPRRRRGHGGLRARGARGRRRLAERRRCSGAQWLLWAIGTVDDRRTVSPALARARRAGVGSARLAGRPGLAPSRGRRRSTSSLTCLWVLTVVNAFNLFDNMDGAAGTMALVVAGGAAMIGVVRGDVWLAVAAASLCGACLGFLPRNLARPARIFLGDGGSMPVGFAVAVLVMVAAGTITVAWRSLLVALLLVALPALDTSLVIVSRRRRGVSVLSGGRDHLTHRARRLLPSTLAVVLGLGVVQAATSALAVLASRGNSSLLVIGASIYLLAGAGAIVVLETQHVEEFAGQRSDAGRSPPQQTGGCVPERARSRRRAQSVLLRLLRCPDLGTHRLAVVVACAIALVLGPLRPGVPAVLSLAGLLGLGVWSLASSAWAESVENAVVSGNRWLAYGALFLLLLALVRHERRATVLLGAATLGVGAVAVSVLVRMLGSSPASCSSVAG